MSAEILYYFVIRQCRQLQKLKPRLARSRSDQECYARDFEGKKRSAYWLIYVKNDSMMPVTMSRPTLRSMPPRPLQPEAIVLEPLSATQEECWQAVLARKLLADGLFFYAVRTTGIYCRPSCPSRRPARKNVVFYPTSAEAHAAGYRPCKRCQPDHIHPQASRIVAACRYLDERETAPTLSELGQAVQMSPYALQRLFQRVLGLSPRQYWATRQTHRLQRELATDSTVTRALYAAGYGSSSRLYEHSDATLGMTPGSYKRRGAGQKIVFTTDASPLGRILVAATERGICAVALATTDAELCSSLQRDFAQADLQRGDAVLAGRLAEVLSHMQEHPLSAELALDVRATAFQRRVWEALQQIPRGQTRSYGEIARQIGQPTAVRAVARACSQNPVAVIVPCHRVIGKDGQLTGYRWGVKRKQKLLAMERASMPCKSNY